MMKNLQEKIHVDVIDVIEKENKDQDGSVRKIPKRELNALCEAFVNILEENTKRVRNVAKIINEPQKEIDYWKTELADDFIK